MWRLLGRSFCMKLAASVWACSKLQPKNAAIKNPGTDPAHAPVSLPSADEVAEDLQPFVSPPLVLHAGLQLTPETFPAGYVFLRSISSIHFSASLTPSSIRYQFE